MQEAIQMTREWILAIAPSVILKLQGVKWGWEGGDTLQWRTGWGGGGQPPPAPEIPRALQNRTEPNPIVKTVKNC